MKTQSRNLYHVYPVHSCELKNISIWDIILCELPKAMILGRPQGGNSPFLGHLLSITLKIFI